MPPPSPDPAPSAAPRPAAARGVEAPSPQARQARLVRGSALLSGAAYLAVAAAVALTDGPALVAWQLVGSAAAAGVALVLLRRDALEAAAWTTTLTLAATPIVQAALDAGLRDPALILVSVAPLVGAMTAGRRLAHAAAGLSMAGTTGLLVAHLTGAAQAPLTDPAALVGYAFAAAVVGAAASAVAGGIYLADTRQAIAGLERQAARLNAELDATEARYRSIVEHLPVGMARTAPTGRILVANHAFARMIGARGPQDALGLRMDHVYADPGGRAAFQEAVAADGFVRGFESQWRALDGTLRTVRIDARAVRLPTGEVEYYEGVVEDVTAARSAAEAVARSEARFRALVQRSSDVVAVVDRGAQLTYVSPAVGRLLGLAAEGLTGRLAFDLVHPDDLAEVSALFETMLANPREARQAEVRLRHDAGHYVFVEVVGAALFDDPAVEGAVLNLRDVTERKRAQAILVQAKAQAEEVARLKGAFLANMSHEIRTPLTAILGFSDILADEVSDPQQQEFLELIARSGRRLMDTLNSVLDLARLEAGRGELDCRPLRAAEIVTETARLMGPAAAERGLVLAADVRAPDAEALLDEAAFARVLHNLVGNALKFTEAGTVTVGLDTTPEGRLAVTVADTGIGIDAEFLPRLFGEFEQESTGVERSHEGAGLGLSISKHLVERMGGTIAVASTKGVGTVFTLTFDRVGAPAAAAPADARPRLLVVDDNEHARLVAERLLGGAFRVQTAASGPEALRRLDADPPDAVVLDINLGDDASSGIDVLHALRAMPAVAALPVVAVTAYGLPGDRTRLLAEGFDDYLPKPYTREQLVGTLRRLLGLPHDAEAPRAAAPAAVGP